MKLYYYPDTYHTNLSKEVDMDFICLKKENILESKHKIVIEEKIDGIGLGIYFLDATLYIQQRSHVFRINELPSYLKEFKHWLISKEEALYDLLGETTCLFGEWLYHKHSIFYDNLPDYFLEYDIYNKNTQQFLSTTMRQQFIASKSATWLYSVPILLESSSFNTQDLELLFKQFPISQYKTNDNLSHFKKTLNKINSQEQETIQKNTILDLHYEGLYLKEEDSSSVLNRYKLIRKRFMSHLLNATHWKHMSMISNKLNENFYLSQYKI